MTHTRARRMSNPTGSEVLLPLRRDVARRCTGCHSTPHDRGCHHVLFSFFLLDRPTGHLSTETAVRLSTPALKSDPVAVHCRSSRVRIEVHVPLTESLTERQRVVRHQVSGTRSRASTSAHIGAATWQTRRATRGPLLSHVPIWAGSSSALPYMGGAPRGS